VVQNDAISPPEVLSPLARQPVQRHSDANCIRKQPPPVTATTSIARAVVEDNPAAAPSSEQVRERRVGNSLVSESRDSGKRGGEEVDEVTVASEVNGPTPIGSNGKYASGLHLQNSVPLRIRLDWCTF